MLSIQKSIKRDDACTVNILPCRVHHNGPAKVTKRYWDPVAEKDGSKVAYFRGRKLKGTSVRIPEGYKGIVVKSTDRTIQLSRSVPPPVSQSDDEDEDGAEPVKILEQVSDITDITVWGHDQLPACDDTYRKGIDEFLAFADAIHRS